MQDEKVLKTLNKLLHRLLPLVDELTLLAASLNKLVEQLLTPEPIPITILGGKFMFRLPDDQPDVPFAITPPSAQDAEGNDVPLTESFSSSNDGVVSLLFDDGSTPTTPRAGKAHIGSPGTATLSYLASDAAGNAVISHSFDFTITTGTIQNESGGDVTFEGITELP